MIVAGVEGFEPPNAWTKTMCLTTWRHPNNWYFVIVTKLCDRLKQPTPLGAAAMYNSGMARQHQYSQHFLRSPRLALELIGHSNLRKNDTVYDIGAGSGVITSALARRVRQVIAVEIEPTALKNLALNTKDLPVVTIMQTDALQLVPSEQNYKIFANPPFAISASLVRHFTSLDRSPKALYLITQKQFARKLVPSDRHFTSQLGAEIAPWYAARIRKPLHKTDFTPPPAVDTVLLELKQREQPLLPKDDQQQYAAFVERCYTNQQYFASINGTTRHNKPSEIPPEQWCELFLHYANS